MEIQATISNLKKRIEELENESKFWYKKYNESLDELEKKDKIIQSRDKRILELEAGKLGEKEDLFLLKTEEEIKKEVEVDQIYLADIQLVLNFFNNFFIKV
jgi:arginyl-tRNA synthetase